jgi:hypothetical protein
MRYQVTRVFLCVIYVGSEKRIRREMTLYVFGPVPIPGSHCTKQSSLSLYQHFLRIFYRNAMTSS